MICSGWIVQQIQFLMNIQKGQFAQGRILFPCLHYRPPSEGWRKIIFSVCPHFGRGGSVPVSDFWGRVPGLRFSEGYPVSDFRGGYPVSDFWGEGYPVSVKGKNFDTRFGLIHVQTGKNIFCWGTPPPSKGENFWDQIWLDTCSDWEKKFLSKHPPPLPPVKGKIFETRFGLIHVQTGEKNFCQGTPPPPRQ